MIDSVALLFCYRNYAVRLRLPVEMSGVERFLLSYFAPFFHIEPDQATATTVATIEVSATPKPAEAPAFETGRSVTIDGSKGFLAMTGCSVDREDGRWVLLCPSGATVHSNRETRRVRLFAPDGADIRIPVLRLIEDVVINAVQNDGGLVLHAAAVAADGMAVVAIGNKGAGKTSFLCHCLESFATSKLANDNVCVFVERSGIIVRGWPSFFKANVGTVVSHEALVDQCPVSARGKLDDDHELWSIYDKVAMYPDEIAAAFGAAILPEAPLGCIILPQFSLEQPTDVTAVSPDELRVELGAFIQGVSNRNHPEWLGINPVNTNTLPAILSRYVDAVEKFSIPVARIRWGPSFRDLLRRVPALRATDRLLDRARRNPGLKPVPP